MNKISLFAIALLVVATATLTGCVKKTPVESPQTNGGDVIQNNTEDDGVSITESEDGKWKTYRNEKIGFEFRVPGEANVLDCNSNKELLEMQITKGDVCDHVVSGFQGIAIGINATKFGSRMERMGDVLKPINVNGIKAMYYETGSVPVSDTGIRPIGDPLYWHRDTYIPLNFTVHEYDYELEIRFFYLKSFDETVTDIYSYKPELKKYHDSIIESFKIIN